MTSRLPSIPAPELAAIWARAGSWEFRAEVLRPGDVVRTNLSDVAGGDWVHSITTGTASPDQPVGTFQLSLLARADGRTVAPGIRAEPLNRNAADIFAPLVYAGAYVWIYAGYRYLEGVEPVMRFWCRGRIDRVSWPGNDVVATVASPDRELERAWVETEGEIRGESGPDGLPLPEEIEDLLHTFSDETAGVTVLPDAAFPTYADLGVGEYKTSRQELGPFLRQQALRVGADFRYWYNEAAGEDVPTFFMPPRDHTVPDATIGPGVIEEVSGLDADREGVRPHIEVEYFNTALGRRATISSRNEASRIQYGRAPMFLIEGDDSPVKTEEAATNLLGYAAHDRAQPPVQKQIRVPFNPWLSIHDVLGIHPDDVRFDVSTIWSITGLSHQVTAGQVGDSLVGLHGGSPIGAYEGWDLRPGASFGGAAYGFVNLREVPATRPNHLRLEWELGSKANGGVWLIYAHRNDPPTADDWNTITPKVVRLAPGTTSFEGVLWHMEENALEVPRPVAGKMGLLHMEPRYLAGGVPTVYDDGQTKIVHRQEVPPDVRRVVARIEKDVSGTSVDLTATIECSAAAGTVVATVNEGTPDGALLASESFVAPGGTMTPDEHPGLADRYAPERSTQAWWVTVRDLDGVVLARHSVSAGQVGIPSLTHSVDPDPESLTGVEVRAEIREPGLMPLTLWAWVNPDGATSANLEAEPSGYAMLTEEDGYTVGPTTDFLLPSGATAKLLNNRPTHPGVQTSIYLEGITVDGRTTGVIRILLENKALTLIFEEDGEWVAGSISTELALADHLRRWTWITSKPVLDALTPEQFGNTRAFTYDLVKKTGVRYEWDGNSWEVDNSAPVIGSWPIVEAGIVTAEVIASLALRTKLAGIERLIAGNLNIGALDLIATDLGAAINSGLLTSADGSAHLDLNAGAGESFLHHPDLDLFGPGSVLAAKFRGDLEAAGGTFLGTVALVAGSGSEIEFRNPDDTVFATLEANPQDFGGGTYFSQVDLDMDGFLLVRFSPGGIILDAGTQVGGGLTVDSDLNVGGNIVGLLGLTLTGDIACDDIDADNVTCDEVSTSLLRLFGEIVSTGANDTAGAGYRWLRIPNA